MEIKSLPYEKLPYKKKTEKWRRQHLDWAASMSYSENETTRTSIDQKQINYDLLNGILHIEDMVKVLNPEKVSAEYVPNDIQHMPIINSKVDVLRGEEIDRVFDYRVVVTNPNAISSIEEEKRNVVLQVLQQEIQSASKSDEEFQQRLQKHSDYFALEYQDMREMRANYLLNHYSKELRLNHIFNEGFTDIMATGEEVYQVELVSGEPVVRKIAPQKIHIFRTGYSCKVEDADIIVLEDYWSPGQIIDNFYDKLTEADIKKIDRFFDDNIMDDDENGDGKYHMFANGKQMITDVFEEEKVNPKKFFTKEQNGLMPYDMNGNIRVIRMYWKSKKKIKRIKRYNQLTGQPEYLIRSEFYKPNKDMGEEEEEYWINEAWQGTLIGKDIYVDIRPCKVQFNRMSNPSRCHFGIIGTIYSLNGDKPFSMVDMMKPYSYLYDAVHDRLLKLIAKHWGDILTMDLSKIPKGWDVDKWLCFAKNNSIAFVDSFNEGQYGKNTGVLAGSFNNGTPGIISSTVGNTIQQYMNMLEYVKSEMGEAVGISPQREGQISYRETVGGIERATTQSSHITEWLFSTHDDTKKRVLEAVLEVAKYGLKGKTKKFQYILNDGCSKLVDIDGDMFAECDYGLVVDNSTATQALNQQLDTLAQAALQNQALNFGTIMRLYSTSSIAEKQRYIEKNEQEMQQQQQMQMQQEQEQAEKNRQMELQKLQMEHEFQLKLAKIKADAQIEVATITANMSKETTLLKTENNKNVTETVASMQIAEDARQFNIKTTNDINKTMIKANAKIVSTNTNN